MMAMCGRGCMQLTLSLSSSSWVIFFNRSLMRDAFESLRRKAGRKCMDALLIGVQRKAQP